VKWYDGYGDVEAVMYMRELLDTRNDADANFAYAYKFVRDGEDIEDIEVNCDWSTDDTGWGSHLDDYVNEMLDVEVSVNFYINQKEVSDTLTN